MRKTLPVTLVLAGALLSACADDPSSPNMRQQRAHSVSTAGANSKPVLYPKSQKYRDAGLKPATGRAGSATLTALALLAQDGTAELTVSAGAPGTLTKLQVKAFDPAGVEEYTLNYNNLSSASAVQTYGGRAPHGTFQVQANIKGADKSRNGVVTVTETIKRRPDLTVALNAPAEVLVNALTDIYGIVSEVNGDVGADANCRLSVDGTEVDQAEGIWIDAGSTVQCAFSHQFTTVGDRQVTVSVDGASPTEWDDANNSASQTVKVVDPTPTSDFHWSAYAGAWQLDRQWHNSGRWDATDGRWHEWQEDWTQQYEYEHSYLDGWLPGSMMAFPISVSIRERSGTNTIVDRALVLEQTYQYDNSYYEYYRCGQYYEQEVYSDGPSQWGATPFSVQVCSYSSSYYGDTWTNFHLYRHVGHITYVSTGYSRGRDSYGSWDNTYWVNRNLDTEFGGGMTGLFGDDYSWEIKLDDGNLRKGIAAAVTLQAYSNVWSNPLNCSTWTDSYQTSRNCYSSQGTDVIRHGSGYGYPTP